MTSRHRYAELHAHSAYSFLDGANEPDDLATAAVELGLEALALTDHDGVPGIVKHAQAGRAHGLPTVHGTELTLADGSHLPVLARNPVGYHRLVSAMQKEFDYTLKLGTGELVTVVDGQGNDAIKTLKERGMFDKAQKDRGQERGELEAWFQKRYGKTIEEAATA